MRGNLIFEENRIQDIGPSCETAYIFNTSGPSERTIIVRQRTLTWRHGDTEMWRCPRAEPKSARKLPSFFFAPPRLCVLAVIDNVKASGKRFDEGINLGDGVVKVRRDSEAIASRGRDYPLAPELGVQRHRAKASLMANADYL